MGDRVQSDCLTNIVAVDELMASGPILVSFQYWLWVPEQTV